MPGSVVFRLNDTSEFERRVRAANTKVVSVDRGVFGADILQVDFERLWLQAGSHTLPVTAHISVPPVRAPIFFLASDDGPTMQHAGADFGGNDILVWGRDSAHYQRFPANFRWASMSLSPAELGPATHALMGRPIEHSERSHVRTPRAPLLARLRDLHAQARRLAVESPSTLAHPEISRALEALLVHAMATCHDDGGVDYIEPGARTRLSMMARFEEFLASKAGRSVYLAEICQAVGASESTLRRICREHLGMGPNRFLLLRRLHLARRELLMADRRTRTVTEIATDLGFWELGRFAAAYRAQFGETPSATLHRNPDEPKPSGNEFSL